MPGPIFLIGGSNDSDVVLADPLIPAIHSYLMVSNRGVRLRHLGELPTVFVNGYAVEHAKLEDDCQIQIGPFEFVIRINWTASGNVIESSPIRCAHLSCVS